MKKLKHYPDVWQTHRFSMETFEHFVKEERSAEKENSIEKETKKERKSKLKLALGW